MQITNFLKCNKHFIIHESSVIIIRFYNAQRPVRGRTPIGAASAFSMQESAREIASVALSVE